MKCPKCKNTIKEGMLYCSVCGKDIQYVPEFEAELENEMDKALSSMIENINLDELSDDDVISLSETIDFEATSDLKNRLNRAKRNKARNNLVLWFKNKKLAISLSALMLAGVLIAAGVFVYTNNSSLSAVQSQADDYFIQKNYELASNYYEKAITLIKEKHSTVSADKTYLNEDYDNYINNSFSLAKCLYYKGDVTDAISIMDTIIKEERIEFYSFLIDIYEKDNNYPAITVLLNKCKNDSILERFIDYISNPPRFEQRPGSYDDLLELTLLSEGEGHIYYTLDGSEPTKNSDEYKNPITLKEGKNVVRAVFVNKKGIFSDSISGIYEIENPIPGCPVVIPQSGKYTTPKYVEVSAREGCGIYYTSDGTMPDEHSAKYTHPLLMSLGNNIYKFVAIDEKGRRSDITTADYELNFSALYKPSEAENFVLTSLIAIGRISDFEGNSILTNEKYSYSSIGVVNSGQMNYYIIREKREGKSVSEDDLGKNVRFYAVDTQTGMMLRAYINDKGRFYFKPLDMSSEL